MRCIVTSAHNNFLRKMCALFEMFAIVCFETMERNQNWYATNFTVFSDWQ